MKVVKVSEPKQYRTSRQTFILRDVVKTSVSKDGKFTTLTFSDGYKSRRMTRNIKSITEVTP